MVAQLAAVSDVWITCGVRGQDEMTISVFAIFTRPTCRSQMFRQPLPYE